MDANVELAIVAVQDENGILFVVYGASVVDAHEKWALVEVLDENVVGAGTSGQRMPSWRRSVLAELSEPARSTQCWAESVIHVPDNVDRMYVPTSI